MRKCQQCSVKRKNIEFNGNNKTCEKCLNNTKRWWRENKERCYRITIKSEYGLSSEDYDNLLVKQNHVCAICGLKCKKNKRLCVDHCHKTNIIRGLLCDNCNRALGFFKDDIQLISSAWEYLNMPLTTGYENELEFLYEELERIQNEINNLEQERAWAGYRTEKEKHET